MFPFYTHTNVGQKAYTPAQLAFFQRQVAAAEGSAMFPGNATFALTSVGQLTSAQITAQQRTQDLQRQVDALSTNVNALQRELQSRGGLFDVTDPLDGPLGGVIIDPQLAQLVNRLRVSTTQLQALRGQLVQAQQVEAQLRNPPGVPRPIRTTGSPRPGTITTAPPSTSEFPVGDVPAAPGAAPNYLVPAVIAVGAVALLAGGYYLTRPR